MNPMTENEAKELLQALSSTISETHRRDAQRLLDAKVREGETFSPEALKLLAPFIRTPEK